MAGISGPTERVGGGACSLSYEWLHAPGSNQTPQYCGEDPLLGHAEGAVWKCSTSTEATMPHIQRAEPSSTFRFAQVLEEDGDKPEVGPLALSEEMRYEGRPLFRRTSV